VACLEFIKHPIASSSGGKKKTPHVMLVDGIQFAVSQGFVKENLLVEDPNEWKEWFKPVITNPLLILKITIP
jgi:N4-(beta-N-acetylglucosaminyl)-L-asparaginase